jgi:drug/metabolite transporter (DMT)-like permease
MIMTTISDNVKGHGAACFTILVWGSTFVATKVLLRLFDPIAIILFRFLLGWAFLWLLRPKRLQGIRPRQELMFAMAGLTGVTLNYLLETYALVYIQASTLSVIASTSPFFVGLLAMIVLKQRLHWNFVVGFLVSITGILLICFPEKLDLDFHPIGILLALAVAFVWAIYSILMEKLSAHQFDVILVTRRTFFYGLLFMIPFVAFHGLGENLELWLEPKNLLLVLYLGIVACALSYVTWNTAVSCLGSVKAALYFYVEPVLSILLSVIILKETITLRSGIGMVLALTGVTLSKKTFSPKKQEDLCHE